jgi:transcriptional regulator with XRE-family HTH domain
MPEETFAERLGRLATEAHLADTELASILEVSEVQAKRYKEGTTPSIKFRAFLRLARRLKVSPWYLAGETEPIVSSSERPASVDIRRSPGSHLQPVTIIKPGDEALSHDLPESLEARLQRIENALRDTAALARDAYDLGETHRTERDAHRKRPSA